MNTTPVILWSQLAPPVSLPRPGGHYASVLRAADKFQFCIALCLLGLAITAELLKREGYATAHFGKWHVGRTNPARHGFDESDGATNNDGPDHAEGPAISATPRNQ